MDYHSSGQNATLSQPPQNQMSHSLSSPSNMDSPGASASQEHSLAEIKKQPSKMFSVQVHFLDGTIGNVQIQYKALGKLLFEQVCKMLNLLEVDYFGLEYSDDAGVKYWLDYEKPMCRQLGLSMVHPVMYFSIKFYTPDPAQLEEEYTRYLFSLQIKKDLAQGLLQCNENTAALMASYIVQSECGDYNTEDYPDHTYLSSYKFVPNQDADFQRKIMENHKKHVGQTPSEADLNLLETARRCELYGIRMTPAKDNEGVPLNLATAHMGVLVFQNYTKINTFSWAKIRKLSFKRKRFLIKLHPEGYGFYKDSVEFNFESRNECKNFWKKCIENHAFFRCAEVKKVPRQKTRIFSRGSSFRYSGRTQKQIVEFVRENYIKRQPFQRSTSLRVPSSTRSGVGTSISAQPLLPVSGSQSCGSVIISSDNASSNRPSSPSDTPPRPPPHQHANSVSQPVSPTHHRITNGGSSISNERDSSPRAPSNGYAPQSRGGARSDGEDDSLPTGLKTSDLESSFDNGLKSPDFLGQEGDDNVSHDSYLVDEKDVPAFDTVSDSNKIRDNDFTESVLKAVSAKAETLVSSSERVGVVADPITSTSDKSSDLTVSVIGKETATAAPALIEKDLADSVAIPKPIESVTEEVRPTKSKKREGSEKSSKKSRGKSNNQPDVVPVTNQDGGSDVVKNNGNGGEIEYILHKRLLTSTGSGQDRKKRKPRVRVEMERPRTTHGSPTLYARASRISSSSSMGDELSQNGNKIKSRRGSSSSPKGHRLRTVDYVSVHQLPAMRSFSSQDDSLEDDSFEKDIFEQFRKRRLSQGSCEKKELKLLISSSKSDDSILKNSCADFPFIDATEDDYSREDTATTVSQVEDGVDGRASPEIVKASGLNAAEALQPAPDSYNSFCNFPRASSPVEDEGVECDIDGIVFISERTEAASYDSVLPDILPALLLPPPSPPLAFQTKESSPDIYEDYVSGKHHLPTQAPPSIPPPPPPPPPNELPGAIPKLKAQQRVEEDLLSQTSSSDGTYSQGSYSSDQMHQLSDAQLFETHLILSQEDLATLEDDFPFDEYNPIPQHEVTHTEEIYITLNSRNNEGSLGPATRYSYSAYKYNSFEDGSTTTEGETICDDTSLNGQMEVLEHITEQLERSSYSDDETAVVGEDPSTESLPTTPRSTRSHRSYLELEVIGGAILERTSSFSHGSPTHSATQN